MVKFDTFSYSQITQTFQTNMTFSEESHASKGFYVILQLLPEMFALIFAFPVHSNAFIPILFQAKCVMKSPSDF